MLLAYVSSAVGFFFILILQLHRDSYQCFVKEKVATELKLTFSISEFSKINWESKYREFEWNDKWYDVSRIEKTKDAFIIHCVNDSFEESFFTLIDHWKKGNSPLGKAKILFQPTFCGRLIQIECVIDPLNEKSILLSEQMIQGISFPITSPPPES